MRSNGYYPHLNPTMSNTETDIGIFVYPITFESEIKYICFLDTIYIFNISSITLLCVY